MSVPAEPGGWDWNRIALNLIVVALMVVSIGGQVQTMEATMGIVFALILAGAHDCAAMLALNAMSAATNKAAVKFWAWWVILQAAATGAALNAYHVMAKRGDDGKLPPLPTWAGLLVGIGPILLILPLSHIGSMASAERRRRIAGAGDRTVGDEVADRQRATTSGDHQRTTSPTTSAPPATSRQTTSTTTSRPPPPPVGDRQGALVMTASDTASDALVITNGGPSSSTSATTGRGATPKPAGKPTPRPAADSPSKPARSTARPEWMTDLLVHQVARKLAAAAAAGDTYGRPQLMAEHGLTDWRARALLGYIADRDLAREVAS